MRPRNLFVQHAHVVDETHCLIVLVEKLKLI